MEYHLYPLLILGGLVAGFVNTLAGGGSMLTLPLLIFVGLPANVANGTNRVAILIQNISGVLAFRSRGVNPWKEAVWLCIPAGLGAAVGASVAVELDPEVLERIFGAVLIVLCGVILFQPTRLLEGRTTVGGSARPSFKAFATFFVVGFWGGFAQVGVGFLFLGGMILCSELNLVYANAVKLFVILCFTVVSLLIFVVNGQVAFLPGLVMAVGNAVGARVASIQSVNKGAGWVRHVLLVAALAASLKLLGLFDLAWRIVVG